MAFCLRRRASTERCCLSTRHPVTSRCACHHYRYRGLELVKNPLDLALYSLLLEHGRPRTVIEIGSKAGGSALWFADLLLRLQIDAQSTPSTFPVRGVKHDNVTFHYGHGRRLDDAMDDEFVADHTSGPHRAIRGFLCAHPDEYEIDASLCDFFGYNATWCSNGFLRRVGAEW